MNKEKNESCFSRPLVPYNIRPEGVYPIGRHLGKFAIVENEKVVKFLLMAGWLFNTSASLMKVTLFVG